MKKTLLIAGVGVLLLLSPLVTKIPAINKRLDGPGFCGACHVMEPWVDTWLHNAHRQTASCSDCHIPHDLVRGAYYKAYVGIRDVSEMILGNWPTPIKLSGHGGTVTQENCYRCHATLLTPTNETPQGKTRNCWECHRNTPHSL